MVFKSPVSPEVLAPSQGSNQQPQNPFMVSPGEMKDFAYKSLESQKSWVKEKFWDLLLPSLKSAGFDVSILEARKEDINNRINEVLGKVTTNHIPGGGYAQREGDGIIINIARHIEDAGGDKEKLGVLIRDTLVHELIHQLQYQIPQKEMRKIGDKEMWEQNLVSGLNEAGAEVISNLVLRDLGGKLSYPSSVVLMANVLFQEGRNGKDTADIMTKFLELNFLSHGRPFQEVLTKAESFATGGGFSSGDAYGYARQWLERAGELLERNKLSPASLDFLSKVSFLEKDNLVKDMQAELDAQRLLSRK